MTARAGMANLILRLRGLTEAGASDYALGATTYWSDDQLQDILDGHRETYRSALLEPEPELGSSGVYQYFDYEIPDEIGRDIEEAGVDSIFAVKQTNGTVVSSSTYTVNYRAGIIRFNTAQTAIGLYLDVRAFDLNGAAREVWEQKAAHAVAGVDWKSDNHAISASQEYDHCIAQAERFRKLSGGWQSVKLERTDEACQ